MLGQMKFSEDEQVENRSFHKKGYELGFQMVGGLLKVGTVSGTA